MRWGLPQLHLDQKEEEENVAVRPTCCSTLYTLLAGKATVIKRVVDYGALRRVTFGAPDFAEASSVYKYDPPNHYRYFEGNYLV